MSLRILTLAAGLLLVGAACATEPGHGLPRLRLLYVSAFAGYPTHADAKPIDWSRSNALVGELQGHAGHWRAAPVDEPAPQPRRTEGANP